MKQLTFTYLPARNMPATLVSVRYSLHTGFSFTIANPDWTYDVPYRQDRRKLGAHDVMAAIHEFVFCRMKSCERVITSCIRERNLTLTHIRKYTCDENGAPTYYRDDLKWDKAVYQQWAALAK